MTCIRCGGPMFSERDWYGSYTTCLCCGHVEYESVIDADKALAETTMRSGRRRRPPNRHGVRL